MRARFIAASLLAALQLAGAPAAFAAGTADVEDEFANASTSTDAHGATVLKGIGCGILLPAPFPPVFTNQTHVVITPSGNAAVVCHGQAPVGPSRAIVVNDLPCGTPAGTTTKSHTVFAPSGNVLLTCHVNGAS